MSDIGRTIAQYHIVELIGQGGMANVYKAHQPSINRYVAIKVLPAQFTRDPNFVKRFEQEARAIAALEHPHILPVYDFGQQDDLYYMVMRYVKGGTLSDKMHKSLANDYIVKIIGDVARALDYAHKQGIVHRDIKPSNILMDENGEVQLADFGIAKIVQGPDSTHLTSTGSILGTPTYMAPEQAEGGAVDGRTDIYSLGIVLYELLAGRPPYQADTALSLLLMHLNEPLPPPRSINPQIPEPLERVVIKALEKEPDKRYQSAAELDEALKEALRETETARPEPKSRMSLLVGALVAAFLVCLVASGMAVWWLMAAPVPQGEVTRVAALTPATTAATPTRLASPAAGPAAPKATLPIRAGSEVSGLLSLEPGVLFKDEFDRDRYCWSDEGTHLFGDYRAEVTEGRFRMTMRAKQPAVLWHTIPGADYKDVVVSVDAAPAPQSEPPLGYGLIFRASPKGDYYLFQILPGEAFAVYLVTHDSDQWQELVVPTDIPINRNAMNQLKVKAIGSSLSFWINDTQVAAIEDTTLSSGAAGVLIEVDEGVDNTVDFDNLIVRQPEGAPVDDGGRILLAECFDSGANGWSSGAFSEADFDSDTTINGQYVVTVTAKLKDGYVYRDSLSAQTFDDFALSVEATPQDSNAGYTYGLVFRNAGPSFYTFEVGNDRAYHVYLHDAGWKALDQGETDAIRAGQTNELKVVARGQEMAFFVNGDQVTSLQDSAISGGRAGLVLSVLDKDRTATVRFDNLVASQVSPTTPLSPRSLPDEPDDSSGILFSDSFDSDAYGWATGNFEDNYSQSQVSIQDGKYALTVTAKELAYVEKILPNRKFSDFILTVEATPRDTETHYSYGIAFRENPSLHAYAFEIGNDGLYSVQLYDGEWKKLKDWSSSEAIKAGQTNRLKVIARGSSLTFFVNDEQLTMIEDNHLTEGKISLVLDMFEKGRTATVEFDNLVVQALDKADE